MTALAAGAGPPEKTMATRLTSFIGPHSTEVHDGQQEHILEPDLMAIDPKAVGYETPPIVFRHTWHDVVTYALGVGATADANLDFLYEGRGPKVLPTFGTIPTFAAFDALVDRIGCDRVGMVHHSQRLELLKALKPDACLKVTGRVSGIYDLKRFAMSVFDINAHDESGDLIIRGVVTLLLRNDGNFGGERPPRAKRISTPERDPDFEAREMVPLTQALLYRLSGDYNPLHADPAFAAEAGFDKPILHGLCTFGYAGRAVLNRVCGGDPERLAALQGQFSALVFPGDTLIIRGWRVEDRVFLRVTTEARPDELCLSNAYAEVR